MESNIKMKAIVCDGTGGPKVMRVSEADMPKCGPNDVLVKIEYTAVNRGDCMQRLGQYPPPQGTTNIIGLECCGHIINDLSEIENESYLKNKRVACLVSGGGYAQYAKVNKDHMFEIPQELSFEQAACIPEVFLTAYQLIHYIAQAKPNQTVLISSAASGVGTSLIQLCKKAGLIVIAISSRDQKLEKCKELGADYLINYSKEKDFSIQVNEITQNRGVDIIFDPIGAGNAKYLQLNLIFRLKIVICKHSNMLNLYIQNIECLAMDGIWVMYGMLGGGVVDNFHLLKLLRKRATILFTTLRNRSDDYKAKLIQDFSKNCLQDFVTGKLKPVIQKVFNMSEIVQAHELMESNQTVGKIVIKNDL